MVSRMKKQNTSLRLQQILNRLSGRDEITVADLSEHFQVTSMTIRRDLDALERQGRVTRTHGGAILAAPSVVAFSFQARRQARMAQKKAIAREAVGRVEPGMTVLLDTGTTTLEVAKALASISDLRVLTSSLAIASALLAHDGLELVLLGGTVNRNSPDLSGPLTEDNLAAFRADITFVGADAVDEKGLYTSSQQIARVSRTMLATAKQTVLVADSGKFGETAFARFAQWREIDELITDSGLGPDHREWVEEKLGKYALVDG